MKGGEKKQLPHRQRNRSGISRKETAMKGGEKTVMASAVVVFAMIGFRTLYELKGGEKPISSGKLIPNLIGFGFVFFVLSIVSMGAPELAAAFSVLVAVGATIVNGGPIMKDITHAVSGTTALGSGETSESEERAKAHANTLPHPQQPLQFGTAPKVK